VFGWLALCPHAGLRVPLLAFPPFRLFAPALPAAVVSPLPLQQPGGASPDRGVRDPVPSRFELCCSSPAFTWDTRYCRFPLPLLPSVLSPAGCNFIPSPSRFVPFCCSPMRGLAPSGFLISVKPVSSSTSDVRICSAAGLVTSLPTHFSCTSAFLHNYCLRSPSSRLALAFSPRHGLRLLSYDWVILSPITPPTSRRA
jgi:hypothetical protein